MPTILELFKQANNNSDVTVWDGTTQKSGIVDKVKDFVSAELNPNGPRVLFYKKLITPPFIYGSETPRISLQGAVDPPRTLSVRFAKYQSTKSTSGKITLGSLLGGSANRPSDTIFESKLGAPVTRGTQGSGPGDYAGLRNSVDGSTSYYVSQYPMGKSPFAGVLKGDLNTIGANVVGAGISAGKSLIKKQISKIIKKTRKNTSAPTSTEASTINPTNSKYVYYKPAKFVDVHNNDSGNTEQKYTTHKRNSLGLLEKRTKEEEIYTNGDSKFDIINNEILTSLTNKESLSNDDFKKIKEKSGFDVSPYVLFQLYRESGFAGDNILLPGTISGLSEENTPEWSTFKFVGSPFNQYRYLGVERSISFELKLYATDSIEMDSMKKSINKLRKLVYPDEKISAIQYNDTNDYSPIVFNGNLTKLTINGLYENLLGFIETLSISIDDSTSWVGYSSSEEKLTQKPHPSVINISIGFKVINEVTINNTDPKNQKLTFKF